VNNITSKDQIQPDEDLANKLKILILLRVMFGTILLGASLIIQTRAFPAVPELLERPHYFIIGAIYGITIVYLILFRTSSRLRIQAYVQVLGDTVLITAIIYSTGGIESIFSFLYILNTFTGAIILFRRGGILTASFASILYGVVIDLHFYGLIRPLGLQEIAPSSYRPFYALYLIIVHLAAFYLVAILTSYLSEQLRRSATALKAKELDFSRLESLHECIIKSMSSGLIVLDAHGRVVLSNPAARQILSPEAEGTFFEEHCPILVRECITKDLSLYNFENQAAPSGKEIIYCRRDGTKLHLRVTTSPLMTPAGQGEAMGCILIFQDITEIKRIEEAIQRVEKLATIGGLAAGIAHEIKNPLASISGSIQVLKGRVASDKMDARLMDIVVREINRLNSLVNDFLLFARPKKVSRQRVVLAKLMSDFFDLFKNAGNWKADVKIITDLPPSLEIHSDPAIVGQILWNLFLNASEAMADGGTLFVSSTIEHNDSVRITMRDTGAGFKEEALKNMFVPFFTTKERGSGLGLAIVRRLAEELKGQVSGRNHPDGGAEITLILPSAEDPSTRVEDESRKFPPKGSTSSRRVLISEIEEAAG